MIGTAGTGKSFTINAITHYLGNKLIGGETLHSLLEIPVQNNTAPFLPLKNEKLKELQEKFKNCKFLIIDEFSMLSQVMIAKIYTRLRQIKPDVDSIFGGISVILPNYYQFVPHLFMILSQNQILRKYILEYEARLDKLILDTNIVYLELFLEL